MLYQSELTLQKTIKWEVTHRPIFLPFIKLRYHPTASWAMKTKLIHKINLWKQKACFWWKVKKILKILVSRTLTFSLVMLFSAFCAFCIIFWLWRCILKLQITTAKNCSHFKINIFPLLLAMFYKCTMTMNMCRGILFLLCKLRTKFLLASVKRFDVNIVCY